MPESPGKTRPVGASGKIVDFCPGRKVFTRFSRSVKGLLYSQRRPTFKVKLDFTFQSSCAKKSNAWLRYPRRPAEFWTNSSAHPLAKSLRIPLSPGVGVT